MTDLPRDEVVRLARECGFQDGWLNLWADNFQRFAALVRAATLAEIEAQAPVAWVTDYELDGLKTGFIKQMPARPMSLVPAFPPHQVVNLYAAPQPQPAPSEDARDAIQAQQGAGARS